jgi:hypothetical protein
MVLTDVVIGTTEFNGEEAKDVWMVGTEDTI